MPTGLGGVGWDFVISWFSLLTVVAVIAVVAAVRQVSLLPILLSQRFADIGDLERQHPNRRCHGRSFREILICVKSLFFQLISGFFKVSIALNEYLFNADETPFSKIWELAGINRSFTFGAFLQQCQPSLKRAFRHCWRFFRVKVLSAHVSQ